MPPPPLALSLQFARFDGAAAHRAALPRHRVARWLRAALSEDVQAAEITVRIVDAGEGRQLNRDYRGKDYATNVLTFDYAGAPEVAADLVLCAPVVAREARHQLGRPLQARITRTCWCTARCTPRAGTTRPARPTPRPWKRARPPSWPRWALPTHTATTDAARRSALPAAAQVRAPVERRRGGASVGVACAGC